jgi:transposase
MKMKRYTVEFKVKAVELLKSGDKSQLQIAKELGISDSTLSKWRREYESGLLSNDSPQVQSGADKEIARLTAELKRKTMEVEILKKATAFFARENL